jgi:hypothetical protein
MINNSQEKIKVKKKWNAKESVSECSRPGNLMQLNNKLMQH